MTRPINEISEYAVRTNTDDQYIAPECRFVRFDGGHVENRGRILHSGWIVSIDENDVCTTLSGSRYALGLPSRGTAGEAAAAVRQALSKLSEDGSPGYHPATLAWILRD